MQASRPSARGFIYVGLLMLVAIIGITAAAGSAAGSIAQRRAAEEELLFVGSQFRAAFKSYYEMTPPGYRRYPAMLEDLLKDPRFPAAQRHLRRIYVDPLTGRTDWVPVIAPEGGIMGVRSRFEGRPIKMANFPEEFRAFERQETYAEWVFFYR